MRIFIIVPILIFFLNSLKAQKIALHQADGAYWDSNNKRGLIVPFLELREDSLGNIYKGDSMIFNKKEFCELCIYELIRNEYLVISSIRKEEINSPIIYLLGKQNVMIYNLKELKSWSLNLNGGILKDIKSDKIKLLSGSRKTKYIRLQ